jgi:hypothetical protein
MVGVQITQAGLDLLEEMDGPIQEIDRRSTRGLRTGGVSLGRSENPDLGAARDRHRGRGRRVSGPTSRPQGPVREPAAHAPPSAGATAPPFPERHGCWR